MIIGILSNPLFSYLLRTTKAYRAVSGLSTYYHHFRYIRRFLYGVLAHPWLHVPRNQHLETHNSGRFRRVLHNPHAVNRNIVCLLGCLSHRLRIFSRIPFCSLSDLWFYRWVWINILSEQNWGKVKNSRVYLHGVVSFVLFVSYLGEIKPEKNEVLKNLVQPL